MYRPRLIPILLLKNHGLVKSIRFNKYKYIGDPINAVKIFNDLKADELVFLDIMASSEKRDISIDLVKQISEEAFMPFSVGGGIKEAKQAEKIIENGAEKVILNSHALSNPNLISEISKQYGTQSVAVSIDVKKNLIGSYSIYSLSGTVKNKVKLIDWIKKVSDLGAGEIIINSINNDGLMNGYDLNLIKSVSESVQIPVVACGGAGSLADIKDAISNGAHAAAAGSLFVFHGPRKAVLINYPSLDELKGIYQ